jgi:hypothetical protein
MKEIMKKFIEKTNKLIPGFSLTPFHLSVSMILPPMESLILESRGRILQSKFVSCSCLPSIFGSMSFSQGISLHSSLLDNSTKNVSTRGHTQLLL